MKSSSSSRSGSRVSSAGADTFASRFEVRTTGADICAVSAPVSAPFAVLRLVRRQPVPASAGSSLPSAETRSFPSLIARRTSLSLHPSSRANSRMLTVSKGADILGADPFGDL